MREPSAAAACVLVSVGRDLYLIEDCILIDLCDTCNSSQRRVADASADDNPPLLLALIPPISQRGPLTHSPRSLQRQGMSAPPSPSNSDTPTLGFCVEDFMVTLGLPPGAIESPLSPAASWLESITNGGPMPDRAQLIGLLSGLLQAQTAPILAIALVPVAVHSTKLLQGANLLEGVTTKHFPHVVEVVAGTHIQPNELNEAQWRPEGAQWQQCKTKMTHLEVRLVNERGESIKGSTLQQGGLELKLTLQNATTGETLKDEHNLHHPSEGLLAGVAKGWFETCAAASAWPLCVAPQAASAPHYLLTICSLPVAGR